MTKDEALKLALVALECALSDDKPYIVQCKEAITAIKEALAQPEHEPVAWQVMVEDEAMKEFSIKDIAHDWCVQQKLSGSSYTYWLRPLYTSQPPQRKPLTDEQIDAAVKAWFGNEIVAGRQPFAKRMRAAMEATYGIKGEA